MFKEDLRDGLGLQLFENGDYYYGSWSNDLYEGFGRLFNKSETYEGYFDKGSKHGEGTLINYSKGTVLKGTWKHGVLNGASSHGQITGDQKDLEKPRWQGVQSLRDAFNLPPDLKALI